MFLTKKVKFHRAWLNVIALCLMAGGSFGLNMNCRGVIFNAILTDLGFRAGDLSLFYAISSITGAVAVLFTVKYFLRGRGELLFAILSSCLCISTGAFALCTKVHHFYLCALLAGLGSCSFHPFIAVVVNNWFRKRNGFAIGLAMAATGVVGALANPLISEAILAFGWRNTSVGMMLIGLLFSAPPALLLLKKAPEPLGMQPYGAGEAPVEKKKARRLYPRPTEPAVQPRKYIFWVCVFVMLMGGTLMAVNLQLALFGQSLGLVLSATAYLSSFDMAGNLVGKVTIGALADRFGVFNAMRLTVILVVGAVIMFLTLSSSLPMLYLGSLIYGLSYSLMTTQPMMLVAVYGPEGYKKVLPKAQSISSAANSLYSSGLAYIYDFTGTFHMVFIVTIACCTFLISAVSFVEWKVKKARSVEAPLA